MMFTTLCADTTSSLGNDINLGCSGFVYDLYVAASMLGNEPDGKILLLCDDRLKA